MPFAFHNLRSGSATASSDEQFARAVLEGLSREPKRLPSWLIFDDRGSDMFTEITQLPGYHPAQCEFEIFQTYKQTITNLLAETEFRVLELGAGDGRKTQILLEHFIQNQLTFEYVPIDISEGAIKNLVAYLESRFSQSRMSVTGLAADYFDGLRSIHQQSCQRNFVLFLGSTIGNMEFPAAQQFVQKLRESLRVGDYVMIGFDLMKHPKTLYAAYNDSTGVFERFNLHLLDVLNDKLGANFVKDRYVQQGQYNPTSHAVESFIYSTREQIVNIDALETTCSFGAWETLQTEHSYKYTMAEIEALAAKSGCRIVTHFFDVNKHFVNSVWEVTNAYSPDDE
ncbi:MAG: dimethylhistidine N-methyltransferase [Nitrospirales bacterium]|nr:MAG: dimethylhistidine N-methyltransferase [Nitrospirales bacterium]